MSYVVVVVLSLLEGYTETGDENGPQPQPAEASPSKAQQ